MSSSKFIKGDYFKYTYNGDELVCVITKVMSYKEHKFHYFKNKSIYTYEILSDNKINYTQRGDKYFPVGEHMEGDTIKISKDDAMVEIL